MYFEIVGEIEQIETIAVGGRIQDIMRLLETVWSWPVAKAQGHCNCPPCNRQNL